MSGFATVEAAQRRAIVRLGIDTLIANILVRAWFIRFSERVCTFLQSVAIALFYCAIVILFVRPFISLSVCLSV